MEKMNATFYILTILGALLVPLLAQYDPIDEGFTTSRTMSTDNGVRSTPVYVSTESQSNEESMITSESATIQSPPVPAGEGITSQPSNASTTLNDTEGTTGQPSNASTTLNNTEGGNQNVTSPAKLSTTTKMTPPIPGKDDARTSRKTESTTTTVRPVNPTPTSKNNPKKGKGKVYLFVLIMVIVVVAIISIIYFCAKSRRKRSSVNISDKHEDAQIPLATVEPEICDISPQDVDMKTFVKTNSEESPPTATTEEQKTEEPKDQTKADPEVKESPEKSEAPAEKPSESMDDADPTASNQTSVETLNDVLNENNSNNNAVLDSSVCFIDICLND